jgi:hypothetical protein
MEITLKNKCCLYVIISIRFFSMSICNLLIDFSLVCKILFDITSENNLKIDGKSIVTKFIVPRTTQSIRNVVVSRFRSVYFG